MATQAYYTWDSRGRPYTLIAPAAALVANLRAHGLTVYHYPNEAHLQASVPEDHTPYSVTGWPGTNAKYNARGVDVMPRSSSYAHRKENADIARQLIKDRNAGVPGVLWIKYINWTDELGICRQERWMPNHTTRASGDEGHIHISGRSDVDNDQRANGYDPIARMNGADDMDSNQAQQLTNIHEWVKNFLQGNVTGTWPHSTGVLPELIPNKKLNEIDETTTALTVGGVTQDQLVDAVKVALLDPEVLAALKQVAFLGAQQAEQQ